MAEICCMSPVLVKKVTSQSIANIQYLTKHRQLA
jgi:hypothetical protein